jgi:hypothetical protein
MFTANERLNALESGIIQTSNSLYNAATDAEINIILDKIRGRIINLYARIATLQNILNTSEEICTRLAINLEAAQRI